MKRDRFPDILRGFALFGIALVNIPLLAIDPLVHNEGADLTVFSNASAAFVVMALFQAKFYLLFSFLFGYSAQYLIKGSRQNRGRWAGRSIGLVILGILHFSLLFFGDILFLYGLFGLLLLAFYFRKDKTLKVWAWIIYAITALLFVAFSVLTLVGEQLLALKGKAVPELLDDEFSSVMTSTNFVESIAARLDLWFAAAPSAILLQGTLVFVAFLVGVLAARKGYLVSASNSVTMKKLAVWGLTLGLPLQLFSAYLFIQNAVAETYSYGIYLTAISINFLTAPILSAGYVGLMWLISQRLQLGILASAGKYSLTIYLSQSVVFATLFSGWGFGLFSKLGVLEVTLIAAATWLALAVLAHVVGKSGGKGPMETLLTGFSRIFEGKK
ncbi:MAG: hypothetical protein RLZZ41_751 [Actinomycetota bacterium]